MPEDSRRAEGLGCNVSGRGVAAALDRASRSDERPTGARRGGSGREGLTRVSPLQSARRIAKLLDPIERRQLRTLVLVSAVSACLETLSGALVFALLTRMTGGASVVGSDLASRSLRSWFPGSTDRTVTVALVVVTVLVGLGRSSMGVLETHLQARRCQQYAAHTSERVVQRYSEIPIGLWKQLRGAEFVRDSVGASEVVFRQTLTGLLAMLTELLGMVAVALVILLASPVAAVSAVLAAGTVVFSIYRPTRRRAAALGAMIQEQATESMARAGVVFGGLRDVRMAGASDFFRAEYAASRWAVARTFWRAHTLLQAPRLVMEGLLTVTVAVVAGVVALQDSGAATISMVGLFGYAGFRILPSANRMVMAMSNTASGTAAIEAVERALTLPSELDDEHGEVQVPSIVRSLRLDSVRFATESGVEILRAIDIEIAAGERIALVGPSGGGKTTLVEVMAGLVAPTSGRVLVDGIDLAGRRAAWRSRVGLVSQSPFILDGTIRQNVAFGRDPATVDDDRVWAALERARLAETVRSWSSTLDESAGEYGARLSGGERQRLAIARALYAQPPFLIFDEATSALDNVTEAEIGQAIDDLARDHTIVIVAHRLSTVRQCARLYLVVDGTIAASGSFDDLNRTSAEFRSLVGAGSLV